MCLGLGMGVEWGLGRSRPSRRIKTERARHRRARRPALRLRHVGTGLFGVGPVIAPARADTASAAANRDASPSTFAALTARPAQSCIASYLER